MRGKVKLVLRDALIVLLLISINSMVFSQIKIDAITTGYHTCFIDGVLVDEHTDKAKAVTHCNELKLNNTDANVWFTYPTQTRIEASGFKSLVIDTIQVIRVKDVKGWIDYSNLGTEPSKGIAYLPFYKNGIIDFKIDTIYNWQSKYNFKRTKTFGKVSYENLYIPIQFRDYKYLGESKLRIWATKQCKISYYVDGVLNSVSSDGFNASKLSDIEYRHTRTLTGLTIGKEYEIKIVIEDEIGEKSNAIINLTI